MAGNLDEFKKAVCGRSSSLTGNAHSEKRWLDDNSVITLTLKQRTFQNAEFIVNGDETHLIWYTQLTREFLQLNNQQLCSGEIIRKNGDRFRTHTLEVGSFIDFVKDKSFRVEVDPHGFVAEFNRRNPNATDLPANNYEAAQMISQLISEGNISKAASYLKPGREYNLIEI